MLASLPMYDFPNVRHDTDALWKSIASTLAKQGLNAPEHLARPDDPRTHWQDNDLLFSQTCGFPYVSELQKSVTLIGTPDYGVVPDKPGWYYSIILCRQNDERQHLSDFAGARFAYNATDSQSGCHAMMYTLKEMFDERRHFGPCLLTGGHINSARFVAEGRADIAAIDVVTWLHLKRDEPFTRELRVLMETSPTPGLPYICAQSYDTKTLAIAVQTALSTLPKLTLNALFLKSFWTSEKSDYELITKRAEASSGVFAAHFKDGN